MAAEDFRKLADRVTEETRSRWEASWVALYAYGGFARNEMDEWSDLDVCLVWDPSPGDLGAWRAWAIWVKGKFGARVDTIGLGTEILGEDSPWDVGFLLYALKHSSGLLHGSDIRDRIVLPRRRKLCLSASYAALVSVRRLYGITRQEPLPAPLPRIDVRLLGEHPAGNAAWQVASAVTQLLRAIAYVETGALCGARADLQRVLQDCADAALTSACAEAIALRRRVPRFGALPETLPAVEMLAARVPGFCARLLQDLAADGLPDPSHEPRAQAVA